MSMLKPHQTNALELNNRNLISEIRVLKVPLLIVLLVTHWGQALLDVK